MKFEEMSIDQVQAAFDKNGAFMGFLGQRAGRPVNVPRRAVRPSLTLERHVGQKLADMVNDNGNGYVYQEYIVTESPIIELKLPFWNNSANTYSIDGCWIRTSDTFGDGGTKGGWVGLTHTSGMTFATALTPAVSGPLDVAARLGVDRPRCVMTDKVNLGQAIVPRVDGGKGYVYELRIHIVPGATPYSVSNYDYAQWADGAFAETRNLRTRRLVATRANSLDASTAAFTAGANSTHRFLMGWIYTTNKAGITFSVSDDSNGEALGYLAGGGYAWKAVCKLRKEYPELAIELANFGWGGATTAQIMARARDLLDPTSGHVKQAFIFVTQSSNDGVPGPLTIAAARRQAAECMELCAAVGASPIFRTPMPNTALGWTAPQDADRMTVVEEVKALRNAGAPVIDTNRALSDGATPARIIAAYTDDGTHGNEAAAIVHGEGEAFNAMQLVLPV